MKTKLITTGLILVAGIASAQWVNLSPNIYTTKDYVGINTPGTAPFNPLYPFHVVQNDATGGGAQIAGYFDYTVNQSGNHAAIVGVANDPAGLASELAGVVGDAFDGYNNYGGSFSAGNSNGNGGVTIGCYAKLDPVSGPNSAGICAGVYGDDWSTGGSGGMGPNWGGFFVGDVSTTTNYYIFSDRKIKTNIQPLTHALDRLMLLKPSTYTYKTEDYKGLSLTKRPQMGLIAQEVEEVFPDLVKETGIPGRNEKGDVIATGEKAKTVNYVNLIPVLIAAMQEQQKEIELQKQQIADLMAKTSGTSGMNSNGSIENMFGLSQNEPNPFSSETTIRYNLPETTNNASLLVYDLSGKQVASFPINKGSSSIVLSSEKLSAGIYIYSIVADNKILDSKRMVVAQK